MSKDETKVNENLVGSTEKAEAVPTLQDTSTGVIGTAEVAPKLQKTALPKAEKAKKELVAIYTENNRFWDDVGRLEIGYNFVEKKQADAWLTQEGIRLATPEEVKANLSGDQE